MFVYVQAEDIKIGVFLGFTGPIESTVANMAPGAELAIKEVSDSGKLLGGSTVTAVRGDTTCIDAAVATATAERLITSDGVKAIVGGDCSGVTTAMLKTTCMLTFAALTWQPLGFARADRMDNWIRPVLRGLGHLALRPQSREFTERSLARLEIGLERLMLYPHVI